MAAGCGSTGISPRPMLMGAAHDALRASNARVSLSCLRVLAHRLPHLFCGLVFIALLFGRGPVLRTCNRVMAHRPTGSAQTDRNILLIFNYKDGQETVPLKEANDSVLSGSCVPTRRKRDRLRRVFSYAPGPGRNCFRYSAAERLISREKSELYFRWQKACSQSV